MVSDSRDQQQGASRRSDRRQLGVRDGLAPTKRLLGRRVIEGIPRFGRARSRTAPRKLASKCLEGSPTTPRRWRVSWLTKPYVHAHVDATGRPDFATLAQDSFPARRRISIATTVPGARCNSSCSFPGAVIGHPRARRGWRYADAERCGASHAGKTTTASRTDSDL